MNVGDINPSPSEHQCWVCQSPDPERVRKGIAADHLEAADFRITDANYGKTGDIFKCRSCGFLQCSTIGQVLEFYQDMDDDAYEATRAERSLQSRKLLEQLKRYRRHGTLLDVGAGSGILVEQALALGFDAEGIEPSVSLQSIAAGAGHPVRLGVLPNSSVKPVHDSVTLVDVIEHVTNPGSLLDSIWHQLPGDGLCLIVTPDVGSVAAKLLRWRWWHFRIGHVGYFNRHTLTDIVRRHGFSVVSLSRPGWYFPAGYLSERALKYLPKFLRFPVPRFLDRVLVPLNLFDSILLICRKDGNRENEAER